MFYRAYECRAGRARPECGRCSDRHPDRSDEDGSVGALAGGGDRLGPGLLGACAATYEAGGSGFGLARAFASAGIRCEVAAPSKIVRSAGDRVKTDAKDAMLLAKLLRMDEISPVRSLRSWRKLPGFWCGPGRTAGSS